MMTSMNFLTMRKPQSSDLKERGMDYHIMTASDPDRLAKTETVMNAVSKYVDPGTIIYTDESKYYTNLSLQNYNHFIANHSAKKWRHTKIYRQLVCPTKIPCV